MPAPYFPGLIQTGQYMAPWTTGVLPAALAANAFLAGIRCGPTQTNPTLPAGTSDHPTTNPLTVGQTNRRIYINEISLQLSVTTAFTASQQFGLYLVRYSVANLGGGGTWAPFKGSESTVINSVALAGGPEGGEVRVATTAALTTAGVTIDPVQFPIFNWSSASAGDGFRTFFDFHNEPIRLDVGEGLALVNQFVWPIAGQAVIAGSLKWHEASF